MKLTPTILKKIIREEAERALKEGSIRHDPWTSEDTRELTQLLSRLLTDHGDAPPAFVRQQLKPGIAAIRKLIYSQDFIDWHNSGDEETAELELDVDPRFSRLELDEGEKSDYARRATDPQALMVGIGGKIEELANEAQQTASVAAEKGDHTLSLKFQAIADGLGDIIEMMQEN